MSAWKTTRWATSSTSFWPARSRRRWGSDMPGRSPSQTVGPYFAIALPWKDGGRVTGCSGEGIVLEGQVFDGAGKPVPDVLVETWQNPDRDTPPSPDGKPH